jgi:glutaredoxin
VKTNPVTLYSTPECEACGEARKLLNARGIPFKEVSVVEDAQIEQLKKTIGSASVPSMTVGKNVQKGFEEGTYHRALDAAGYPRQGVLPPRSQAAPGPNTPAQAEPAAEPAAAGPYSPDRITPGKR